MAKHALAEGLVDEPPAETRQDADPVAVAVEALGPYEVPRAPSEAEWTAMSEVERKRAVDALPAGLTAAEIETMADGDWHWEAKVDALDTLRHFFEHLGKRIYLAAERRVYYPAQPSFVPDLLAVLDVDPKKRTKWVVSAEGKGIDWVMEVLHLGDRKKDLLDNVEFYAHLGIPEYFIYDCGLGILWGYRLSPHRPRSYEPIAAQAGRYPSVVLGLELGVAGGQLQFYYGSAELLGSAGLIRRLRSLVTEVQEKRQQEWARAEQERVRAEQEQARLHAGLRQAVLAVLAARGLEVTQEQRARLEGCADASVLERWLSQAASAASADGALAP